MDRRGWPEKWDELEERADPMLMPLIISLRADMELFAAAAQRFSEMGALALKQRQQILDAQAVESEHRAYDRGEIPLDYGPPQIGGIRPGPETGHTRG